MALESVFALCWISIHAPREGSDQKTKILIVSDNKFLSTLPARGATESKLKAFREEKISIHAPREGSDLMKIARNLCMEISIHAPREGSDDMSLRYWVRTFGFLSTLPARGATEFDRYRFPYIYISIHAPREGSDRGRIILL